jgi:hypothetical protein
MSHAGHRRVHDDHVWPELGKPGDRLVAAARLAHHRQRAVVFQQTAEAAADEGVIVDEEH